MNPVPELVYVVDDDSTLAFELAAILRLCGFAARSFRDPTEAVVAAASEFPALLIADVLMPELSGLELAIELKSLCPGCQVLMISGYSCYHSLVDRAYRLGFEIAFLPKPISPGPLIREVTKLVRPTRATALTIPAERHT
jgi:FixJ family two-component response regulator